MNQELELIKEIIILEPPTKYTIPYKKPKFDTKGNFIKEQVHYLTANLFYIQNVNYHIISKITHDVKLFLFEKVGRLPELEKMALEFEYHKTSHIDLDNKIYFFKKLLLDILKTPTQRQIDNATKRKKSIITTNTIPDDNTKFMDYCSEKFVYGEHKLIIRIYGRVKSTQTEMPLFFV